MLYVGWLAMTYVLGSIPFGLFIAKAAKGIDPRLEGSGNVGATNVARLCGFGYGVATLALDLLKGYLPVLVAMQFSGNAWFLSAVALAALCGHMFSVFLNGRGGKAVATTVGVFLALAPAAMLVSATICVTAILYFGYVSLGSLALVAFLPVFLILTGKTAYVPFSLIVAALVIYRHKDNIARLRSGTEKSWKKPKETQG